MGRGILSGLIWGSIISIVVLGTVSLLSPMAEPALPVATGTADTPAADSADAAEPAQETAQVPDSDPVDAGVSTEAGMPGTQTASEETAPETDVGSDMTASDGGAPVAQLDTPTAETLPKPAEGPAATAPQTEASGTEVASGVELPAGSEFRKALPETEAAVPGTGAAPEGPIAPAAPAPGNEDLAAASPQTNVPHRPATPGMSVTAPIPPSAEAADAGDVGGAPTDWDTATPVPEPALPSADGGEAAPDAKLTKGFPPPVRTEAVEAASTAETVAAEAVAVIVDAETALPDVPGAPAVSPDPETGGAPVVASTAPSATGGFAAPQGTSPGDVVTAVTEVETDSSADMAVAPADSLTGVQPDTDIVAANEAAAVETAQPVETAENGCRYLRDGRAGTRSFRRDCRRAARGDNRCAACPNRRPARGDGVRDGRTDRCRAGSAGGHGRCCRRVGPGESRCRWIWQPRSATDGTGVRWLPPAADRRRHRDRGGTAGRRDANRGCAVAVRAAHGRAHAQCPTVRQPRWQAAVLCDPRR